MQNLLDATRNRLKTLLVRWPPILKMLARHARAHRYLFMQGALMALLMVGIRLTIPWMFHRLLTPYLAGLEGHSSSAAVVDSISWSSPATIGALVFTFLVVLGFADYRARLCFARFAIGMVRDLRAEVLRAMFGTGRRHSPQSGDLVSRLIGDIARLKAGTKGFLIHVATNGLLFVGVTIALLYYDARLALVFASVGLIIAVLTTFGALLIFERALKYRAKEGSFALAIEGALRVRSARGVAAKINRKSAEHEAALTKIQGLITWSAHAVYGAATVGALFIGISAVSEGRLSVGNLVVFMFYALMLRAPTVQLARQGARTGKILACGDRLHELLVQAENSDAGVKIPKLATELSLVGVVIKSNKPRIEKNALGPIDLCISHRTHLLLTGPASAGKTTLLEVLSGSRRIDKGEIRWDGTICSRENCWVLGERVGYVDVNYQWPRQKLSRLLKIEGRIDDPQVAETLRICGVVRIERTLMEGLNSKMAASDFSREERHAFLLARAVLGVASLLLLDDPFRDLSKKQASRAIATILQSKRDVTVIYACREVLTTDGFDGVIRIDQGRLVEVSLPSSQPITVV